MTKQPRLPIWKVVEPSEQLPAPEWMSFHAFKEAQRCPLSVSLQRSSYRQLWDRPGYPFRPTVAAISGMVVHDAAETILKKLVNANVLSLMDAKAMSILKELGGFTKVLERCLSSYFESQHENPRFEQLHEEFSRSLKQKLPNMRATLQALLLTQSWKLPSAKDPASSDDTRSDQRTGSPKRFALSKGTFVEVNLEDALARWRGRADIIELEEEGCFITDLKSGDQSKDHVEQLTVYSMLWLQDSERNPSKSAVTGLKIVYASGSVSVPVLDDAALKDFRTKLISSSEAVRAALNATNVPAKPSPDVCRYCPVKLLCNPYWSALPEIASGDPFSSTEVRLAETRGDRAWLATVVSSSVLRPGETVLVRNHENGKAFWKEMKAGLTVRFTDGLISVLEESEIPTINLSMMSEALFLPAQS